MSRLVLVDNEAVQALARPDHPKHRKVISLIQVVASRKRRAVRVSLAVPTAVRAEAGWDRTSPACAFANRLRIADIPLDASHANVAAALGSAAGGSVADAHLGAAAMAAPDADVTIVTSDPADMRRAADGRDVTIVTI
jgi:predicted nucleic acid-binding protein